MKPYRNMAHSYIDDARGVICRVGDVCYLTPDKVAIFDEDIPGGLVLVDDEPADTPAKGEPSALYAASEPEAGASADLPDLSELAAAKVVKLAQSLGYPGERRKPDALEFLAGLNADKVAAALADLLDD